MHVFLRLAADFFGATDRMSRLKCPGTEFRCKCQRQY